MFEMFHNKSFKKVENNPHVPEFWKEFVPHHSSHLPSAEIRAHVTSGPLPQTCVGGSSYRLRLTDEETEVQRGEAPCPKSHSCGFWAGIWAQKVWPRPHVLSPVGPVGYGNLGITKTHGAPLAWASVGTWGLGNPRSSSHHSAHLIGFQGKEWEMPWMSYFCFENPHLVDDCFQ